MVLQSQQQVSGMKTFSYHQSVGCRPPKMCSALGAMNVIRHQSDVNCANDVTDILLCGSANMTFL
jgi:hypothetical protein